MKNNGKEMTKKLVLLALCGCLIGICGCGNVVDTQKEDSQNSVFNTDMDTENTNGSSATDNNEQTAWDEVVINGEIIKLPCTLADLEKQGIVANSYMLQSILETTNEVFYLVAATGENVNIYLHIETGDDIDKGKENCIVSNIANKRTDRAYCHVGDGVGIGSTVDEVLDALGRDYYSLTAVDENNLKDGYVLLQYGDGIVGYLFHIDDGIVSYMEVFDKEGERQ